MSRYIAFFLFTLSLCTGRAQKIHFESSTVHVGNVLWNSPVTATFQFSNRDGRQPLLIREVDAGCGCLSVVWPKNAVSKGTKEKIQITYDSKMLGHFDRFIDVYTNASERPVRIRMKGCVTQGEQQDLEELYPYRIDNIGLNTNNIEFPDVHANDSTKVVLEVLNDGTEVYKPQLMHLPAYITAKAMPEMLARGRRGKIELTLHGDLMPSLGLNQTQIYVARYSGDRVGTDNDLTVSAVLLPDMQEAEKAVNQPDFRLSTTELKLGKLGKKSKLKGKVIIENKGTETLKLSNIQAFNRAVSISLPQRELKAGERMTMNVSVEAKYLGLSKAQPRILIITNDPKHCKEVVNVVFEK